MVWRASTLAARSTRAYDLAEQLFNVTALGMRVIVTPSEVAPVEFADPALLRPKSDAGAIAAARTAEADAAVETQSRPRPTPMAQRPRSTGSPSHRTYWIASRRPPDLP
jgi:hypothetical protein